MTYIYIYIYNIFCVCYFDNPSYLPDFPWTWPTPRSTWVVSLRRSSKALADCLGSFESIVRPRGSLSHGGPIAWAIASPKANTLSSIKEEWMNIHQHWDPTGLNRLKHIMKTSQNAWTHAVPNGPPKFPTTPAKLYTSISNTQGHL